LLDSDDVWFPGLLDRQVTYLQSHVKCDVVYADGILFGQTPLVGTRFSVGASSTGPVTLENLLSLKCNVLTSTVVAKRATLLRLGLFETSQRAIVEDWEYWVRLVRLGAQICYQQVPLVRYRIREGSLSSNPIKLHQYALNALELIEASHGYTESEREAINLARRRFRALRDLEQGKELLMRGEFAAAKQYLKSSNENIPSGKLRAVLLALAVCPWLLRAIYAYRSRRLARLRR
jgi:hypothetical protein